MYDRTSSLNCVNQVRKQLFAKKGRSIESIPPTKAALLQHSRRATYQASYCWGQALKAVQDLPCPSNWGWKRNELDGWQICWSTLPEASKACRELLRCGCKKVVAVVASALRQHLSALHFVSVAENAFKIIKSYA